MSGSQRARGTPLAEDIRAVLLARREERMCDSTELLLVCAARVQHVQMVIEPALARGDWVISDRFGDATLAYQGAGRGMDTRAILELHKLLLGEFAPDLTLLLDVPVAAGMQRMQARGDPGLALEVVRLVGVAVVPVQPPVQRGRAGRSEQEEPESIVVAHD